MAKQIYKKAIAHKDKEFNYDAFVCFYIDDYKFDGIHGIWNDSKNALKILRHFSGTITPDFSTYQDFPEPIKLYNTYRMRAFGYWLGMNKIQVINNVRWGTPETYRYCWDGLPQNSILSIGTVGGSPKKLIDRKRFVDGLNELIKKLHPNTILVYGSSNYPCFEALKKSGVKIYSYPSQTNVVFTQKKVINEQA